ncbi:hypothetical protein [Novosphingobium sp. AP12]|uniref:hypothetical protein n=1 Tax=Novosphingobium sp. AP12 TaxID=1144305 RepID=UPI000272152E|nr:hypothetical protein [Novosphingobium sp. AP12]EJL23774.1 hypothetical protein PMI02_04008 [Novosphingobium sp. AP12]
MISPYRRALPLVGALALLAGCGGGDTDPSSQASGTAPADSEIAASEAASGAPLAAADDAPLATPAPASPAAPISCSADVGEAAAARLAEQCRAVSPATRPPCNAANSCAMIRNEIARGCAILGEDAAKTPQCKIEPISREAAADLVSRFYAAINARDYAAAWSLWGPYGNPEQTLDEFAKGYANTRRTHVEIGKVSGVEGGAGSLYVTVPVTIDAELDNGRRQRFTGSYDLRQINRGMGISQGWHIMSAKLKPA